MSSYGGNSSSRPSDDCSPDGHQLGVDPEGPHPVGGGLTDAGDLHAGERAGVQTELVELLPHRAHRVGGGEHHPLEAAVDQTLDRALHLRGAARRLDGDGRHLDRQCAVADQPFAHLAGLILGARHQHGPAVQGAALPPVQLRAVGDGLADGHHQRPGQWTRRLAARQACSCRADRPAWSPPNAVGTWCRSRSRRSAWCRPARTRSACAPPRADETRWRAGSAGRARRPAPPSPRRRGHRPRCAPIPAAAPHTWAPPWCRADPARSRNSGASSPVRSPR